MTLVYNCPHCGRNIQADVLSELSRTRKKVVYKCVCNLCRKSTDVSVSIDDILAKAEERVIDKFGFSLN